MNKKLVKSIIPLCIFILFITTSLQKANDRYNDTAVVEAMVNDEEKNNEENDKAENKSKIDTNKSFDVKLNPELHFISDTKLLLNQTIENSIKSNENVGFYDLKRLSSFVKRVQTNIFNNIPTTLKNTSL